MGRDTYWYTTQDLKTIYFHWVTKYVGLQNAVYQGPAFCYPDAFFTHAGIV